jgi:hypothetical protein
MDLEGAVDILGPGVEFVRLNETGVESYRIGRYDLMWLVGLIQEGDRISGHQSKH